MKAKHLKLFFSILLLINSTVVFSHPTSFTCPINIECHGAMINEFTSPSSCECDGEPCDPRTYRFLTNGNTTRIRTLSFAGVDLRTLYPSNPGTAVCTYLPSNVMVMVLEPFTVLPDNSENWIWRKNPPAQWNCYSVMPSSCMMHEAPIATLHRKCKAI